MKERKKADKHAEGGQNSWGAKTDHNAQGFSYGQTRSVIHLSVLAILPELGFDIS